MPTYEEVLNLAKLLPLPDQARLLRELRVLIHPVEVEDTDEIIPADEVVESEIALQVSPSSGV
jgi:hypothetical protein